MPLTKASSSMPPMPFKSWPATTVGVVPFHRTAKLTPFASMESPATWPALLIATPCTETLSGGFCSVVTENFWACALSAPSAVTSASAVVTRRQAVCPMESI
jgi:hypothetical protein